MLHRLGWLTLLITSALRAQSGVEGTWQGTLDVGAVKLRLGLHVNKNTGGDLSSTLDSIDQGAMGIPVKVTTFSANALHLELPIINAKYDGKLNADGSQISGTFVQGMPLPLTFKRVEKVETLNRPQNPKPPYPYDSQDVTYEPTQGIKLAGTLTLPRSQGPFPAALLITGSGPQDRDETLLTHKPFWVIADYLTRRGIAVLRVDDRGVGGSTGNSTRETLDDMVGDVVAGVAFLKSRKEIDPKHIGVIGHSEGAVVGPVAAVRSSDIAFVVMLAGTGVVGEQVVARQAELIAKSVGASDELIAKQRVRQQKFFDIARSESDEKLAMEKLHAEWQKMKATLTPDELKQADVADQIVDAELRRLTLPEMRSFLFFDPIPTLRKLKVPVLALNGSRDLQVSPEQNLPPIAAALASAGNSDFTITEIPGLNHLFQKCKKCTVQEYGELEETLSPTALEIVGDWLVRHK